MVLGSELMGIGGEATEDAGNSVVDGVGKVRGTGSRRCGGSRVVECRGIGCLFAGLGVGEGGGGHGCRGVVHERFQEELDRKMLLISRELKSTGEC